MPSEQHDIIPILIKHALYERLTPEEKRALAQWRLRSDEHSTLPDQFRDLQWLDAQRKRLHHPPTTEMWNEIRQYIDAGETPTPMPVFPAKRRIRFAWFPAAAVLLVAMIFGGMRWRQIQKTAGTATQIVSIPAIYRVLLVLDDGSMMDLDTLKRGAILSAGGLRIRKTDSNSYVYMAGPFPATNVRHRLLVAPTAGVVWLQWTDGSSVWIRPGTRLDYAVDLRADKLNVEGEAWFKFSHRPAAPARIALSNGTMVRVLGTSFVVRSVPGDSSSRVALFSGKVRVVKGSDSLELRPGWQMAIGRQHLQNSPIDSNASLTWMRPRASLQPVEKGLESTMDR